MKRICLLLLLLTMYVSSRACDCLENNHARFELDEYSIINAKVAVILEVTNSQQEGDFVVLTASLFTEIKKSAKKEYILKARKDEFDLFALSNGKVLFLLNDFALDTIIINHCSQLWRWVDDLNKANAELDYIACLQRHAAVSEYLAAKGKQEKSIIRYSTVKKTGSGKYLNGKATGAWLHYAFNGDLFARGDYDEGVKEGQWIESFFEIKRAKLSNEYYQIKMGYAKGIYRKGIREGKWIFFNTDYGTTVSYYKNGEVMLPNTPK